MLKYRLQAGREREYLMEQGIIHLKNETVGTFPRYPVSRGIPLPASWGVQDPREVSLRDEAGQPVPCAGKVLQRRADGSIEWMLADFVLDFGSEEAHTLTIEHAPDAEPALDHPVTLREDAASVTLSNGITTLVLNRKGKLIEAMTMHGKEIIGAGDRVDLETVDMEGKVYRASVSDGYTLTLEANSRLRATVLVEGKHAARDGSTFLDFALRFTLTAGRPDVKFQHTFICREPQTGVVEVKALRMVLPTRMDPTARKLLRQHNHGKNWYPRSVEIAENVEIVASSISDINNYPKLYHPYKAGTLFLRSLGSLKEDAADYPFYINPSGGTEFRADYMTGGIRQTYPFIGWQMPDLTLVFGMRWWGKQHPKSVTVDENVLTIAIWPDWATPMRIVQGVSKSHSFWLTGEPKALTAEEAEQKALQWEVINVEPIAIDIDPQWPRFCEVLDCHHFLAYAPKEHPKVEENLRKVVPGEPGRFTYARNNPMGMFDFADEGTGGSFTNNEDDRRCYVPLVEYLRTGRVSCFDWGEENVNHYMEVDYCMFSANPRKHGGLIPHTQDHFFGEVYPSHQWAEGILAYYYLTGDERARKVVISVGDNNCYWANDVLEIVTADGREAGIPLVNLAAAYRLTGDRKYLDAAEKIIAAFHQKWYDQWGDLKYPYPQGAFLKWTTGYGDYSSYYGLYRIWELTGDEALKTLLIALLKPAVTDPNRFSVDDSRMMDFFAVWAYIQLTGDDSVIGILKDVIDNFLVKGGHEMRRLHFLGYLDQIGDSRLKISQVSG